MKNFVKPLDKLLCSRYNSKSPKKNGQRFRGVAQFGSALGLGPRGRRFESCRPDQRRGEPFGSPYFFAR